MLPDFLAVTGSKCFEIFHRSDTKKLNHRHKGFLIEITMNIRMETSKIRPHLLLDTNEVFHCMLVNNRMGAAERCLRMQGVDQDIIDHVFAHRTSQIGYI